MMIFWTLAAGLAGLAALFVVAPLLRPQDATAADDGSDESAMNLALRREQLAELDNDLAMGKLGPDEVAAARHDLEREALHDLDTTPTTGPTTPSRLPGPRLTLAALAFAVPLSAVLLYLTIGEREIIPQLAAAAAGQPAGSNASAADGMPPMDELVKRLEQRMAQAPEDAEGWVMLGRTYFAMGDTKKAETALERAYALTPKDAALLLAYAEVIAANNERSLDGRPAELISAALAAEPENPTARWLSGMVAFQRGQYASAATVWKKLQVQLDPASEEATDLVGLIAEAETRAGVPANAQTPAPAIAAADPGAPAASPATPTATPPSAGQPAAADSGAAIEVQVELAPELAARVTPTTTVFVYAKAAAGPAMPLAVQRLTVADLPLRVRLDDSMAMMPAMRLSAFPEVKVGARVSPSGLATPQPGDLEGEIGPISSSTDAPVAVRIDHVRP